MTERELYLKAARIIQRWGLARQTYSDSEGRVCMVGAMRTVAGDTTPNLCYPVLREICGGEIWSIAEFSDSCPNKRDAIAALLIAADLAA